MPQQMCEKIWTLPQLGLDAIHFENPRQLAGEFIRRGIPALNSFAFDSEGRLQL
jgi:hypothetical protein